MDPAGELLSSPSASVPRRGRSSSQPSPFSPSAEGGGGPGDDAARRSTRARVVSSRMAVVSEADLAAAAAARLDALEADEGIAADDAGGAASDDEFVPDEDDDDMGVPAAGAGRRRGPPPPRRRRGDGIAGTTRGARAERRGPKPLLQLVEEAGLGRGEGPDWVTAAMGPPTSAAPRRWCAVCGYLAKYTCVRCRARYCGRRCGTVHAETRCLKMVG